VSSYQQELVEPLYSMKDALTRGCGMDVTVVKFEIGVDFTWTENIVRSRVSKLSVQIFELQLQQST
jgi:hypothetical protein